MKVENEYLMSHALRKGTVSVNPVKVLLLGAGGTAGCNFIKSLLLRDTYLIYGLDINRYQAKASGAHYCFHSPTDETEKIRLINSLVEMHGIDVIHAQPDSEVKFLTRNRSLFNSRVLLPSDGALEICGDKKHTNRLLNDMKIPVPQTVSYIEFISGVHQIDSSRFWLRPRTGAGAKAALPISTREEAVQWVSYWKTQGYLEEDFIVSEFLPGTEYAWQSIWHKGKLVTSQSRIRLEYIFSHMTASGQSSSPSVSRTVHSAMLNEIGTKAVLAVDQVPHGIYGIDCKEDRNGQIKVTEINAGRFFSTTLFYAAAGLNFPDILCRLIIGRDYGQMPQYDVLPKDLYWIRALDRAPVLVDQEQLTTLKTAAQ